MNRLHTVIPDIKGHIMTANLEGLFGFFEGGRGDGLGVQVETGAA